MIILYLLSILSNLNVHPLEVVYRYRHPQFKITHTCLI